MQIGEAADEEQIGELLDNLHRIGDTPPRPECVPDPVYLASNGAGDYGWLSRGFLCFVADSRLSGLWPTASLSPDAGYELANFGLVNGPGKRDVRAAENAAGLSFVQHDRLTIDPEKAPPACFSLGF